MPKYCVTLGRTVEEYSAVEIEAPDAAQAEQRVQAILDEGSEAYLKLMNGCDWDCGETHDERITDVTEREAKPC